MNNHFLKTWPEYFRAVKSGRKSFEVRKHDRDFRVGDIMILDYFNPKTNKYNRRIPSITKRITYILKGPAFGIEKGYCVLQLQDL
jgi:ASC-1-like (ASCH) protein